MTFANPNALWLMGILPLLWLFAWSGRGKHAAQRLMPASVARSLVWILIVIALTQPSLPGREFAQSVVYAIDVSRSISPESVKQALQWSVAANKRHRPDQIRYLVFADGLRLLESADQVLSVSIGGEPEASASSAGTIIGQSATDIESALHAAMFGFAPGHVRRLVLISDGNQTRGDLWRAVSRLRDERVRVFSMPAMVSAQADAWVESIVAPPGLRQQEPVAIEVVIRAVAEMPASVELRVGKRLLGRRNVRLAVGENRVAFDTRMPRAGSNVLTAQLHSPADTVSDNNELSTGVHVGPRPRVLYVEGTPASANHLADALRAHFIDVTVTTAQGLDADPRQLMRYDAVIISDLFAHDLGPQTVQRLAVFVRERGGGLVFAAGESTYGKQGYAGNAIERLLPIRFEGKRKRQELDLVLLIDRSHSMRGRKLELAKTAALSTLDLLEEQHRLAVVGFDARAHEVVPLAEVGNKRRAEDRIASVTASGQTRIYPALEMAQRMLAGSSASTKHIILLSDGVTAAVGSPNDAERIREEILRGREEVIRRAGGAVDADASPQPVSQSGSMEELVQQLAEDNVTLSTIAIGPKPNVELLSAIAQSAGGKAYVASNDAEMPGLFVSETRRLLGDSIVEETFRPTVAVQAATLAGVDFAAGPPLGGFVTTRAKQFSEVLLLAPQDQPLLATTQYGLGRTAAFMSDVKNRWSAQWLGWHGYGRFWSQVVRAVMPRHAAAGIEFFVARNGNEAVVEMSALSADFAYRNGLLPKVRATSPGGEVFTLQLRQVAPGQYQARLPVTASRASAYRFSLLQGGGINAAEATGAGERLLSYTWTDEYRLLPPNNALLRQVSDQTGGVFAARTEDIFAAHDDVMLVSRSLWYWFVAAALLLFLLDILIRRAPRAVVLPRLASVGTALVSRLSRPGRNA